MDRTALITGASRGIGAAIAERFRRGGLDVVAPERAAMDLASNESIDAYVMQLRNPIDIVVNNAGINILSLGTEIKDDDLALTLQTNLVAPLRLLRTLSTGMKRRGYGRILNMSSIWSVVAKSGRSSYAATKAAVNAVTRTLAIELAPFNVLVNAIAPGYVDTELTRKNNSPDAIEAIRQTIPLRRLAEPGEIAEIAFFLCSDLNSYVTGQTILVDGGFTCQ